MQSSSTAAAAAAAAARADEQASAAARPAPFSASPSGVLYTCQQCHKTAALDVAAPVAEATIKAFEEAFFSSQQQSAASASAATGATGASPNDDTTRSGRSNSLQQQQQQQQQQPPPPKSAMDLLSESFVVLPASRSAQSVAPSSLLGPAAPTGTMGAGSAAAGSSASASSAAAAAAAAASPPSAANFHKQVETASRVLEIVSARCSVAQPLCTHCAHSIFADLERKRQEIERDKEEYAACIAALQAATDAAAEASSAAGALSDKDRIAREEEAEDAALAAEEAALESRLSELSLERESLSVEFAALTSESQKLSSLEAGFWREYEDYALALGQLTAEQTHLRSQIRAATDTLDRLKRTNVFDDAFHISYDGHFATINGFRLGRLPAQPVDWPETSAALGQVLLLLTTMARHCGYKFTKYRLLPMGSYSKMARLDDLSTTYELYGSNDLILGRLFWYRRFDTALVWLLACIQEFAEFAQRTEKNFTIKYPIKSDTIGDVSIKLQFNNDAKWTKALKNMLVVCRQLLLWFVTSKHAKNTQ